MQPQRTLLSHRAQIGDGIDHAVWKAWRRTNDHDRPLINAIAHGLNIGEVTVPGRHTHHLHTQHVAAFVGRGMRAVGHDDLGRAGNRPMLARPIPTAFHRHHDALGATGRHTSRRTFRRALETQRNAHHLGFHAFQAWKGRRA